MSPLFQITFLHFWRDYYSHLLRYGEDTELTEGYVKDLWDDM